MLYYCSMTTLGSIAGCLLLYSVGRKGGQVLLRRKFAESKIQTVSRWYGKYGVFTVMIPSILPPPTPFKIFVLCAGAFKIGVGRFIFAITSGRGFRYFFEGYLAVTYGDKAVDYMHQNYPHIALAIVSAIILGLLIFLLVRRTRTARQPVKDV